MGRYVVREAEEYYDMNECDARGYPVNRALSFTNHSLPF